MFAMLTKEQLETLFSYVKECEKYPRISYTKFHKNFSHYKKSQSTLLLIQQARKNSILFGPMIWCNRGFEVEILSGLEDPLLAFESRSETSTYSYLIALIGSLSLICFKKGASIIQYAEAIVPSFPSKKSIKEISLEEKGKLPTDEYPRVWDKLDWRVFDVMRNPYYSYTKAGQELGISWHTIKNHFERIIKDCRTWISIFPKGYNNYQQSVLVFRTEYETSLRNELCQLDRTTVLYKFEDKIMLHLFSDELLDILIFYKLKRKGIIHDLHVSIPIGWYSPYW